MNVKLLRRIQKHILAEPRRYNQDHWLVTDEATIKSISGDVPPCGTMACVAGWACELSNNRPLFNYETKRTAQRLLGIDMIQASLLFSGVTCEGFAWEASGWPKKFVKEYVKAKTARGRASVASRRIDHFIKTKGAE